MREAAVELDDDLVVEPHGVDKMSCRSDVELRLGMEVLLDEEEEDFLEAAARVGQRGAMALERRAQLGGTRSSAAKRLLHVVHRDEP